MKRNVAIFAGISALAVCLQANADLVVDLGGGWQATIFDEINVGLVVDYVSVEDDVLVIQKIANFISVDPITGQPDPVRIAFSQILPDEMTVSRIVITDEILFNNTGLDWTSYRNELVTGPVAWDPVASADFDIAPFLQRSFSDDNRSVTFFDGVIMAGTAWTPGKDEGELVINIDLTHDTPVNFLLKELALTPAPGALALLGLAGLARRRRRD